MRSRAGPARKGSSPTRAKFRDPGRALCQYQEEFLVVCPECGGCGHIRTRRRDVSSEPSWVRNAWRMVCGECGHFARWDWGDPSPWAGSGNDRPSGCGLPLWLQTMCRGRLLWAYNGRHLGDLSAFVEATDRGRGRDPDGGMATRSMLGALPRWLIIAKNRPDVLRGLARLRKKLLGAG